MATAKQIAANKKNAQKAGRKKGSLSASTLERIAVNKAYQQKVMSVADILFRNKLHLAQGVSYLYKIEKYYSGTGKNRVLKRKKPKLVTAPYEIEQYLEERISNGDLESEEDTYYYITTDKPSNQAIEDLLDRGLGKVPSSLLTEDDDGNQTPSRIIGMMIVKEPTDKPKKKDK